jgi:ABC-type multidrug transport system fused ATPase/permease subunit
MNLNILLQSNITENVVIVTDTLSIIFNYISKNTNSTQNKYQINIPNSGNSIVLDTSKINNDYIVSIINYAANSFNNESNTEITILSDLIRIQIIDTNNTNQNILSPFSANLSYSYKQYIPLIFNYTCIQGIQESIIFDCVDSKTTFHLFCSGSITTQIIRDCPIPKQECSVIDISNKEVSNNEYCKAQNITNTNVQCLCGYSDYQFNINNSDSVNIAITTSYQNGYFGLSVSGKINQTNIAEKSWIIFLLFGCLWSLGIIVSIFHLYTITNKYKIKRKKPEKEVIYKKDHKISTSNQYYIKLSNKEKEFCLLFQKYIQSIIPEEFDNYSLSNFWNYVWKHHLILKIIKSIVNSLTGQQSSTIEFMYNHKCKKEYIQKYKKKEVINIIYDIIHVLTLITLSCFVLALLYDFQYPVNDGSCSRYTSQSSCLERALLFDKQQTYCEWLPLKSPGFLTILDEHDTINEVIHIEDLISTSNIQECFYNENNSSLQTTIIIIFISIIVSTPLDILTSYLIEFLRAETNHIGDKFQKKIHKFCSNNPNMNIYDLMKLKKGVHINYQLNIQSYNISKETLIIRNKLSEFYHKLLFDIEENKEDETKLEKTPTTIKHFLSNFYGIQDNEFGVGILYILFSDLLRENKYISKLFLKFINKTFIRKVYVDIKYKWLAAFLLFSMNIGCLIFIVLKGISRENKWQYIYLNACFINWISDIFFIKFMEIFWLDYMIIQLIYKKIYEVRNILYCFPFLLYGEENIMLHPQYNYLINTKIVYSNLLMSINPKLFESSIIMNIIKKLKHVEIPPYIKISNKGTFIKSVKQLCIRVCSYIPLELHRVLSAILSSLFVLLIIILWYNLHILIIVFIIILLSIFILYFGNYKNIHYKKSKHLHKSFQTLKNELLHKHILQINSINSSQNASDSDEEFKIINNDNIVIDLKYMGNSYSNSCDISNNDDNNRDSNNDIIIKCSSSDDHDDTSSDNSGSDDDTGSESTSSDDDTSSDNSSSDSTSSHDDTSSDDDDDHDTSSTSSTSSGSTEETSENKSTELETPSSLCNTNISSISYESIEIFDTNEKNTI